MRMHTNDTNKKLIYPDLPYFITDICPVAHNKLGRYAREKQYGDLLIEKKLKGINSPYRKWYNIICKIS